MPCIGFCTNDYFIYFICWWDRSFDTRIYPPPPPLLPRMHVDKYDKNHDKRYTHLTVPHAAVLSA